MPLSHACLLIIVAAAGGWALASILVFFLFRPYAPRKFLGIQIWGVVPAMQNNFAKELSGYLASRYLQPDLVASHLNNGAVLNQLRPEIEKHVDQFLEQKLPETFPLLSKLMGEKTLTKFKTAFLTEVEVIFPILVNTYAGKMLQELKPAQLIETEIKSISIPLLEQLVSKKAAPFIQKFKIIAAIAGGLIGLLQWLLISFVL